MKVLIACEYSGVVRDAFADLGHDAWSCDLLPTERPGNHIQGDVAKIIKDGWDLLIAHPPCTYLCNSGVRWLYSKKTGINQERLLQTIFAREFFESLLLADIGMICVENPIPHKHARLPKCSQIIQPWMFGHGETKATCLWLKGLPPLQPSNIVEGRAQRIWKLPPGKDRWKERSRTFEGIAKAMADQWGREAKDKAA